jgi:hypothetical protein
MTLATLAFQIASDTDFASMLQNQPERALAVKGINLTEEERTVLQKVLEKPGQILNWFEVIQYAEPWSPGV